MKTKIKTSVIQDLDLKVGEKAVCIAGFPKKIKVIKVSKVREMWQGSVEKYFKNQKNQSSVRESFFLMLTSAYQSVG